tara:strand:+ start:1543 stop:1803 length:261 start_codon:yes stop_codon:yes gene_type:complete
MSLLFPLVYATTIIFLIWKAFKVMSNGWGLVDKNQQRPYNDSNKTKKYTIHPELLDKSGNITNEELLTVRFSNDTDTTIEKGTSSD